MNATATLTPEVRDFIQQVRAQLADLDADELREIADGLEADLSELVAEQGVEALGDPVDYARELRTAAGLSVGTTRRPREVRVAVDGFLDACHAWADRRLDSLPGDIGPLRAWLRPVWWIVRAWAAVLLVDVVFGSNPWSGTDLLPHLRGAGWVVMIVAVLVSIQLGRGKFWPGGDRGVAGRVLLLGINAFAIAITPLMIGQVEHGADMGYYRGYDDGYSSAYANEGAGADGRKAGLYADGRWISQIYPYDAQGHPLVGVQLFDQTGQPIDVVTQTECVYGADDQPVDEGRVYYPWTDGAAQKHNVFPVPSRVQDGTTPDPDPMAFAGRDKPSIGQFPFVKVPAISLPGLRASAGETPKGAFAPGQRPKTPINPLDQGC